MMSNIGNVYSIFKIAYLTDYVKIIFKKITPFSQRNYFT